MRTLNIITLLLIFYFYMTNTNAQTVVRLWQSNPPTDNGVTGDEIIENARISNISDPDITIYLPNKLNDKRAGIIICPGGGYTRLASQHEGHQFAEWLKSEGFVGIVLKYRLPNQCKNVPLEDLEQAIKYVRSKSTEWDIDKVGVAGFSAGGHLASSASTHLKSNYTRPDFSILFYPVISMGDITHQGSRTNLLGNHATANDINLYSNEQQVTKDTPPTLLLLSDDDKSVSPLNSIAYYQALKQNEIPTAMYIFPTGGHGWGMRDSFEYHKQMLSLLKTWLEKL